MCVLPLLLQCDTQQTLTRLQAPLLTSCSAFQGAIYQVSSTKARGTTHSARQGLQHSKCGSEKIKDTVSSRNRVRTPQQPLFPSVFVYFSSRFPPLLPPHLGPLVFGTQAPPPPSVVHSSASPTACHSAHTPTHTQVEVSKLTRDERRKF